MKYISSDYIIVFGRTSVQVFSLLMSQFNSRIIQNFGITLSQPPESKPSHYLNMNALSIIKEGEVRSYSNPKSELLPTDLFQINNGLIKLS